VLDVFTADYVHHMPMSPEPLGLEPFQQMFSACLTAFPDMTVLVEDIVADGDRVAAERGSRARRATRSRPTVMPTSGRVVGSAANGQGSVVRGQRHLPHG
jgi:predicted ester cyclase